MNHAERTRSLHARLLALTTAELAPPHVDPHVAALAALGLVDFARSPEGQARFAELVALDGFDGAKLDELAMLAEALLGIVDGFDLAPRDPKPIAVPDALEAECRARRTLLVNLLVALSTELPGVWRMLKQVELSFGPLDLAVDLRGLAAAIETNPAAAQADAVATQELIASTRALARRLEDVLYAADTPELKQSRSALHRMWALFQAAYREVADVGRELFAESGEAIFPNLDAIAEVSRTARHASSSDEPAAIIVERGIPASRRGAASTRRRSSQRMAAVRPDAALAVEVVLAAHSESNLWLGFSQDLAEGGIFVATYEIRSVGTRVDMSVMLPGADEPLPLHGYVHWVRPPSAGDDFATGIGVRFVELPAATAKLLQAFAAKRTPIFYDD